MKEIIFKPSNNKRFQAPALTNRARLACVLYMFTRIQTKSFRDARTNYKRAWAEHAERLQAELDIVRDFKRCMAR